jgi:hypothetical protein
MRHSYRYPGQSTDTFQVKQVQGPQLPGTDPNTALVTLTADLVEKYLGRGLIGFGPSLEVLTTRNADELLRQHGYDLYRRMTMDSEVDASLDTLIQASSSQALLATSALDIRDPDYELSRELVDFVNWTFAQFDIDSWRREQVRQMLTFGNAVSELDWDLQETGDWANHLVISNLRLQRPEDYGFIVDRWGKIYGVAPLGQAAGTVFPLGNLIPLDSFGGSKLLEGAVPIYKLAVWTWEKRGVDPRGTSALIPAYIPWWSKQRAIEEWSCWLGRYAQPSIWATPGPDAVPVCITNPDGSQLITQPTEALLQALLQFKSASVLALPAGSEVHLLSVSGGVEPFLNSIAAFNVEITRSILGQHLATNEGASSNRSGADVQALVLRLYINAIRRYIAKAIERDIIKPLIQANYGDVGHLMPVIDLGDGDGWQPTVTEVAVLFQSGYFTEDQLPKLDKILGIPIRETNDRVGPGNLPPAEPNVTTPAPNEPPSPDISGGSKGRGAAPARMGPKNGSG